MKIKVLHLVGGSLSNGAAKGANILHEELLNIGVNSKLLTDDSSRDKINSKDLYKENVILIQQNLFDKILNQFFVNIQKILKSLFLHSPRETFTLSLFGFDITKRKRLAQKVAKSQFFSHLRHLNFTGKLQFLNVWQPCHNHAEPVWYL